MTVTDISGDGHGAPLDGVKGKVVAITGASSGIGSATAQLLSARGASVVLAARGPERLADAVAAITEAGGAAIGVVTDVRRRADLDALVAATVQRFGRLDVLVNNAGIGPISRIDALRSADWDDMVDVNLKGVLHGIAAAMPTFLTQDRGHVVNVVSTSGLKIVPSQAIYAATKNAVRTLSEGLRQECVPGLRVTNVSPGMTRTNFVDSMTDPATIAGMSDALDAIAINPDAIARAIAFAIEQPQDVEVGDIVVRPTAQG